MILQGTSKINVDSKGRMAVPTRYRDILRASSESKVVVTAHGLDECLVVFPACGWEDFALQYQRVQTSTRFARDLKRRVLGQAANLELDGSGRLSLPVLLRDFAKIDKKIIFTGAGDHFEIWSEELWNANDALSGTIDDVVDLPESLQNLPF